MVRKPVLLKSLKNCFLSGLGDRKPGLLNRKISYRCNCRCDFCNLWRYNTNELSASEEFDILDAADGLDVPIVSYEGGEPLLRRDLPVILRKARRNFFTAMVTNGFYLKERFEEIRDNIDMITVSIDSVGGEHDKIRGLDGLFKKVSRTINYVKRYKPVSLNCVICEGNKDRLDEIVKFASDLGVVGISFEPIFEFKGLRTQGLGAEELKTVVEALIAYKKDGYPIFNSYSYFDVLLGKKKFICKPYRVLNIDPLGNLAFPCGQFFYEEPVKRETGFNVKSYGLKNAYSRYLEAIDSFRCKGCGVSCYVEFSLAFGFNMASLEWLKNITRYF